ncbi:MAG: hypothetical protein R3332_05925 [Pseudohongiellaceae bacterium]|nr:hypothetical protein [Pseudohongiellaceae bacterium]
MEDKKVAIVDELVITGTTLGQTKKYLEENVKGIQVTCHVLAVNKAHWKPELIRPDNRYLQLDDASCTELGADIVRAMSILPRPYSIDYPLFSPCTLEGEDVRSIVVAPGWESHDITSAIQYKSGIRVITITPQQSKVNSLKYLLGTDVQFGNLPKIRIYGRYTPSSRTGRKFTFRVLSFYIFKPLYEKQLDAIFGNVTRAQNFRREVVDLFTTGKSKLRLLQYMVAVKIAQIWIQDVNRYLNSGTELSLSVDERELSFLFPPTVIKEVKVMLANFLPLGVESELSSLRFDTGMMPAKCEVSIGKEIESFNDAQYVLAQPFYEMFNEKELHLRDLIEREGVNSLERDENKYLLDRLKLGITIEELINYFHKNFLESNESEVTNTPFDSRAYVQLVSLFVDIAVDTGIAVPITSKFDTEQGAIITRCLRHGEEVKVSNRELYLMSKFLKSYSDYSKNKVVPRTFLEKLLVLFIQGGFNSQILEGYVSRLNGASIVSVKHYAFGAIAEVGSNGLRYEFDSSHSLSRMLVDLEVLEEVSDQETKAGYKIGNIPEKLARVHASKSAEWTSAEFNSKAFGELVASGFNRKPTYNDIQDITFLASCLGSVPSVLSLAAEVRVFLDWWDGGLSLHVSGFDSDSGVRTSFFRELKNKFQYKALVSGSQKYSAIEKEWPEKIFKRLKSVYCSGDSAREVVWSRFWDGSQAIEDETTLDHFKTLLRQLGNWIDHIICMLEMISYSSELQSNGPTDFNTEFSLNDSLVSKLVRKHKRSKQIMSLWSDYRSAEQDSLIALDRKALEIIDEMVVEGNHLLETVKKLAGKYGEVPNVTTFESVLRFYSEVPEEYSPRVRVYFDEMNSVIAKTAKEARNPALKRPGTYQKGRVDDYNSYENNRWIEVLEGVKFKNGIISFAVMARGRDSIEFLVYMAEKLIRKLGSELRMRAVLFGDLSKDLKPFSKSELDSLFIDRYWQIEASINRNLGPIITTEIVTLSNQKTRGKDIAQATRYLESLLKRKVEVQEEGLIAVGDFEEYDFYMSKHRIGSVFEPKRTIDIDILIVTILPEEAYAVMNSLNNCREVPESELSYDGLAFRGSLKGAEGRELSVVLVQTLDPGNPNIIITVNHIIHDFSPKAIVLLGIAGSIDKKVQIGDVVIANEVLHYENGKEISSDEIQNRITTFRLSKWSKAQVNRMLLTCGGASKAELVGFAQNKFNVQLAPIGSGDKVLAAEDGRIRGFLKYVHDKTAAVEMEAAGLAMLHESSLGGKGYSVKQILIVRGISDRADVNKIDTDHAKASYNAMVTLSKLLESMSTDIFDYNDSN